MRNVAQSLVPIFRSQNQARVLAALLLRPDHDWTAASLARELGVTSSTLHPELQRLEKAQLITATSVGRSRVLKPNMSHPVAESLIKILHYMYGPQTTLSEEFGQIPGAVLVLIFGSWAARQLGEQGSSPHDIDVLVVGNADRAAVYAAADRAQERIGMPVNPVLASLQRWQDASDALIRQIKASPVIDLTPEGLGGQEETG